MYVHGHIDSMLFKKSTNIYLIIFILKYNGSGDRATFSFNGIDGVERFQLSRYTSSSEASRFVKKCTLVHTVSDVFAFQISLNIIADVAYNRSYTTQPVFSPPKYRVIRERIFVVISFGI